MANGAPTVSNGLVISGVTTVTTLDVNGTSDFSGDAVFNSDVDIVDAIVHVGDTDTKIRFPAADTISFETAGSEVLSMNLDGLVTGGQTNPTSSDNGNIYIKNGSSIGGVGHAVNYVSNAVFNGAWKYITSSVGATRIVVNQGGFQFDTAASGTAGNNITFSNRFNINNSGAIGVGGAYGSSGQVLTSAGSGSATTWSTISSDLVSDASPQLGGDLQSNGNDIRFADNDKARFGASADIEIYHDNSNSRSYVLSNTDNELRILQAGNAGMLIQNQNSFNLEIKTNAKDAIKCVANGAVELYHNNSKKLETTTNGITMTGDQLVIGTNGQIPTLMAGGTNTDIRIAAVGTGGYVELNTNNNGRWRVAGDTGHFFPVFNNSTDIGTSSKRVRNIYTNDLNLSNKGSTNCVDNTWGDYTIQEGESDLYLINNRSGKKYKFNLTEVS